MLKAGRARLVLMLSRRSLLTQTLATAAVTAQAPQPAGPSQFLDLLRAPDYLAAQTEAGAPFSLTRAGSHWSGQGIEVTTETTAAGLPIFISAPGLPLARIHLRWHVNIPGNPLVLADAWERSYGDLGWRSIVPERVMPWYFLVFNAGRLHGYGVETGASALCFWQLDAEGVSLWLDVRNGGSGVKLGQRRLHTATVVSRSGIPGEEPIRAATEFCRRLCPNPRLPKAPIYGSNDWYYAYGKNSASQTLRDAELVAALSSSERVRPFTVIDMGWSEGSKTFPSMPGLASQIKQRQVRPGLWIRPLEAAPGAPENLLLPALRFGKLTERSKELAYDPTIPEALAIVTKKVSVPVGWGYELVKHDFSTYDLLGRWGREMGAEPTFDGWHLHDRSRTNAEVIRDLYTALRAAAGERTLLLGCNTVGHLGAGLFEAQRIGDDTSGRDWERTRRMGVNTLAFRLPQHNTFFSIDPDCAGITPQIPWQLNRQWLDLIARSGAALFISPEPSATGSGQRAAIKDAFQMAATGDSKARPENWFRDSTPERWLTPQRVTYQWSGPAGCSPFDV